VVAALLLWSIAVQWIGTAYDSGGWDRGTRFQVEAPDGTTTDFDDRDAAAAFAKQQGGRITRVTYNVDDRRHRDRLWSVRDTPIAYYLRNRSAALARRNASLRELMKMPVEVRVPGK
jgi:hypothetical protein